MFCGTRSFSCVDADADDEGSWASSRRRPKKPPPTSKLKLKLKQKKKKSSLSVVLGRSAKNRPNPYSASGLDKFEKLLAELEAEKREILLKKKGSGGDDTVRFRYSSAEERIPIVIKRPQPPPPPPSPAKKKKKKKKNAAAAAEEVEKLQLVATNSTREVFDDKSRRSACWNWRSVPWWAVVAALVLLCMVFGRAFAVSWAAILWYMVPMMKWDGGRRRSWNLKRKAEDGKKSSRWLGGIFFRVTGGYMGTSMTKVEEMGDGASQELQASPG